MTYSTAVSLLSELISCPSVTPTEAGVLDVVENFLKRYGFTVHRLVFEGDGSYPVDNIFATRQGNQSGPHLLFCGHTDVVPVGDEAAWTHPPFSAHIDADGVMWGRGATDMKSGVAAFLGAIEKLALSGELDKGTISLAITNDEEADSVNGADKILKWADQQGYKYDFAIVGEPSSFEGFGDSIKIGRRGSLSGEVIVEGKQGHVAYPERANNPLPVINAIVSALYIPLDTGTDHFQPSNLEVTTIDTGNPTANIIPARSSLKFNIRFNETWTGETLFAEIKRRIENVDAKGCTVSFKQLGRVARAFVSPPKGHVAHLSKVIESVTGTAPKLSTIGGTSDARFIADYCPVVECGLTGNFMHQVNERVQVAEVDQLVELYSKFVSSFLAKTEQPAP